jgi:hypothetical protein
VSLRSKCHWGATVTGASVWEAIVAGEQVSGEQVSGEQVSGEQHSGYQGKVLSQKFSQLSTKSEDEQNHQLLLNGDDRV